MSEQELQKQINDLRDWIAHSLRQDREAVSTTYDKLLKRVEALEKTAPAPPA